MSKKQFFRTPELLVWLGFGLSVVGLVAYAVLFVLTSMGAVSGMSGGVTALCVTTLVPGLVGLALSVWGMMRWALLDTPKWLHIASIAVSVANILFPVPSSTFLLVSSMVGKEHTEMRLPSDAVKELKPDIVLTIDARKGVLIGDVRNDSISVEPFELSLTDLDYKGKLVKWAERIPAKANVELELDEKAGFSEVQTTMEALGIAGVKFQTNEKK